MDIIRIYDGYVKHLGEHKDINHIKQNVLMFKERKQREYDPRLEKMFTDIHSHYEKNKGEVKRVSKLMNDIFDSDMSNPKKISELNKIGLKISKTTPESEIRKKALVAFRLKYYSGE